MTDPAALMAAINGDCEALDTAAKRLDELATELAAAELAYLDKLDEKRIVVEDDYVRRSVRLPSEAQRDARAHQLMDRSIRERYVLLKREVDLIEKWGRMREKALSGRQSELSFLRAEANAPAQQPQWSRRSAA